MLDENIYVDYAGDFRAQIGYYGVDHSKTIIWISIMATIIAITIILAVVMFVRRKKRKNKKEFEKWK